MRRGKLGSWSAEEDVSHLFICVCNGSKRSVKFKTDNRLQVERPVGGDRSDFGCWYLSVAKPKNGKGNMGIGESWEGKWRT